MNPEATGTFESLRLSSAMRRTPLALLVLVIALAGCSGRTVDGGTLSIEPVSAEELIDEVRAVGSDLVVVNVWASWCIPCRDEMPDFVRFHDESDPGEVQVRFVTVDFEEDLPDAAAFLREHGVTGETFIRDGKDGPFIAALEPRWSGAVPATFVYDRDGNQLAFWEGKVSYDQLARRVAAARTSS